MKKKEMKARISELYQLVELLASRVETLEEYLSEDDMRLPPLKQDEPN